MGSADGFFDRLEELFGFSIPLSELIIAGQAFLPRVRRRTSGWLGSFMEAAYCELTQQFTSLGGQGQKSLAWP
jgi:hypothetical protein